MIEATNINIGHKTRTHLSKGNMKQTIELDVLEGYELSSTINNITFDGKKASMVFWEKQQPKDFNYFVDEYLSLEDGSTCETIDNWLESDQIRTLRDRLKTKQFSLVPWEIKIGLFRFICHCYKCDFMSALQRKHSIFGDGKIVISQEFIDDLFNTKEVLDSNTIKKGHSSCSFDFNPY